MRKGVDLQLSLVPSLLVFSLKDDLFSPDRLLQPFPIAFYTARGLMSCK